MARMRCCGARRRPARRSRPWVRRPGTGTGRPSRVEHVEIPIARLGKELDGLRIVQLSDVHIGETLRAPWLRRVVERVNALKPDLVAITGDLIDGSVAALRSEVAPLRELTAREGV